MAESITISSVNFNGQNVNVLFKPDNDDVTINLGFVLLPFVFYPNSLTPPREVYGTYSILVDNGKCFNILNVPRQTPTPTPTITSTKTPTPTPTPTLTPTPSPDPCKVPTPTPSVSVTPTVTPTLTPTPTQTCTNPCGCPSPSKTPKPTPTTTINPC